MTFNVPLLCPCGSAGIPAITVAGLQGTLSTVFSNFSLLVGGEPGIGTWDPSGVLVAHLGSARCAIGYRDENATLAARDSPVLVDTSAACAKRCDDDASCLAYEFSAAAKQCYTNNAVSNSTTPASGYTFCLKTVAWVPKPCNVLALKFTIRNAKVARLAADTTLSVCSVTTTPTPLVNPAKNDLAPLFVRTGAITAKMCQSNPWPAADNILTVTLSSNIPLKTACQSAIVISNMDQVCLQGVSDFAPDGTVYPASCFSPGVMTLNEANGSNVAGTSGVAKTKFGTTGKWSYDYDETRQIHGGKLTLKVAADTVVDEEYVISFKIKNPSVGQASPPIRVSGTGIPVAGILPVKCTEFATPADVNMCTNKSLSCKVDAADAAPLKVLSPGFLENQIGQRSPYPCVSNTITVTLRANIALPVDAAITLTNLDGNIDESGYIKVIIPAQGDISEIDPSIVELAGPGAALDLFTSPAGSGGWDYDLKKMTLVVKGAEISAFQRFVFSFDVTNPCCAMQSPAVCVKVNRITAPCNNCTAVGQCGTCASISRQAMDRDFYKMFESGADGGIYNYNNTVYSKAAVITFGKPDLGDAYPLQIYMPGFIPLRKAIGQTTPFPSVNNTITVTIATQTPLTVGSHLTLTGLSDSALPSNPTLSIRDAGTLDGGDANTVFGSTGEWNNDGSLLLTVETQSIAGMQYVFSFQLTNPSCNLEPRTVTVTASCCTKDECPRYTLVLDPEVNKTDTCHSTMGDTQPLKVMKPAFVLNNIWQSNPYPCHNNTISLELDTNVDILPQTKITIEGLTGSNTPTTNENTSLAIDVCGTAAKGVWNGETGLLVFELSTMQSACSVCIVTFVLKNKCCCQESPIQNVKVHADMNCFEKAPALALGAANMTLLESSVKRPVVEELEPLHIRCPAWDVSTIQQGSNFPCTDNVLAVNISFNVPVLAGSDMSLTLTGLHDTQTLSTYPAYEVGVKSGRLPRFENETCAACVCSLIGVLSPSASSTAADCNMTACECLKQAGMPVLGAASVITASEGLFDPVRSSG